MNRFANFLLVGLLLAAVLPAQSADPRIYRTGRIAGSAPVIDGRLDDAAWKQVAWAGDFVQRTPYEGDPPSQETQFKVLYDDHALYLAYRAHDSDPGEIVERLARRDHFPGDWVEVNIDSYHDLRTAFSFTLSASGVKGDEFISNDGGNWDTNWDPIWDGRAAVDDGGWNGELRIPLSQLRYSGEKEQVWGIQVTRRIFRLEERSVWQLIPRDISGWVSRFGELHGLLDLPVRRRLELMPYAVAQTERYQEEPGNPFAGGKDSELSGGLDGKLGVTSDLTLDFTINPDFGQVEADPSQVNLTAFETFFQEKRPFFIEGSSILNFRLAPAITGGGFTQDLLFYSRRVGRSPHWYPDLGNEDYADSPQHSSILGAFKLSGKTAGGLSLGIMECVTAEESAEVRRSLPLREAAERIKDPAMSG